MLSAAEWASMTATVTGALDVTVTISRRTATQDSYGHTSSVWAVVGTAMINATKPGASLLQAYADIIGVKLTYYIRFLPSSDIREGDQITFNGKQWLVQYLLNADSYTVANDALITEVQ